ncbi:MULTISPECIES: diversity-generating retroelement protein Avd [unclassified Halomonas]|uniref:diversity-generating retroelement protein Avd n=1 Tax=unclassified Halomonas TaxID=2609666 RepID=UPI002888E1F3|nr:MULTISPECIES: diversity-generating retroelement protein Avd [unclassified Halomonas]MDT0499713.1 diversity-generating retroelement protein Avd [Halomonas sp. PAR7]MDT0510470.1 diversity-generating retroelement protein Avd [Halomonas sp. LES1]MDT0589821.1 diversity-generating retroelement protein Avd [Halomonas sp. PAR8]
MEDLKIKLKIERMIAYGYAALRQFPKSEKHTLAAEIRQCMYRLLRLVIVTNRRYHKKTTSQEIDAELDLLRSLVRVAMDLGFLPYRQYRLWAEHLHEIGRMVGGWLRWIKSNPPTPPERTALPA